MMKHTLTGCLLSVFLLSIGRAELKVTGIRAIHRNGQTFVTWKDVAGGEEGSKYRYAVYRSDKPITQGDLAKASLCMERVFNNSARLFGSAFRQSDRIAPGKSTCVVEEGGEPLPDWSGLAVITPEQDGDAYYAVLATDTTANPLTQAVAGESSTTTPVAEKVAPIQPIKIYDSKSRKGPYIKQTCVTGKKGLPLFFTLHASNARGGGAGSYGDYYLYFARREWGYREGLPGVFAVQERKDKVNRLVVSNRDTIVKPDGLGPMETYWFGYVCVPQWAEHKEPRAYPFTERRVEWIAKWCVEKYKADPNRVYCSGGSMGAWGTSTWALRHPEIFAAVYPNRPRTRQRGRPSLARVTRTQPIAMDDGKTDYFVRMDMVEFVRNHHGDLPFLGWCCGRHDGFASFKEQIDMVKALTEAHHGFAFAWNDGNHSSGSKPMSRVQKYYPATKFARNRSYPAFGNSSIDDDLGTCEIEVKDGRRTKRVLKPDNGALEGGINLGFDWKDVREKVDSWSAKLRNALAKNAMTVDVTPRRCQEFNPRSGDMFHWTNSAGGEGEVKADPRGLVTIPRVTIKAGEETVLTIRRVQ